MEGFQMAIYGGMGALVALALVSLLRDGLSPSAKKTAAKKQTQQPQQPQQPAEERKYYVDDRDYNYPRRRYYVPRRRMEYIPPPEDYPERIHHRPIEYYEEY